MDLVAKAFPSKSSLSHGTMAWAPHSECLANTFGVSALVLLIPDYIFIADNHNRLLILLELHSSFWVQATMNRYLLKIFISVFGINCISLSFILSHEYLFYLLLLSLNVGENCWLCSSLCLLLQFMKILRSSCFIFFINLESKKLYCAEVSNLFKLIPC